MSIKLQNIICQICFKHCKYNVRENTSYNTLTYNCMCINPRSYIQINTEKNKLTNFAIQLENENYIVYIDDNIFIGNHQKSFNEKLLLNIKLLKNISKLVKNYKKYINIL